MSQKNSCIPTRFEPLPKGHHDKNHTANFHLPYHVWLLNGLKHPNYFVEISVVPIWMKTEEQRTNLVRIMRSVGIEHFIFGSDWPVIHPAETLKAFDLLPLNKKEKNDILYSNAEKLNDLFEKATQ